MEKPVAFLSYVHADDKHLKGKITELREKLSESVRFVTGGKFEIFQDKKDISLGQVRQQCVAAALRNVIFFIPIITPSYFTDERCRAELQQFIGREQELGRNDLILSVYLKRCDSLEDPDERQKDNLAQLLMDRDLEDWRGLHRKSLDDSILTEKIESMAEQINQAMRRVKIPSEAPDLRLDQPLLGQDEIKHVLKNQRDGFAQVLAQIQSLNQFVQQPAVVDPTVLQEQIANAFTRFEDLLQERLPEDQHDTHNQLLAQLQRVQELVQQPAVVDPTVLQEQMSSAFARFEDLLQERLPEDQRTRLDELLEQIQSLSRFVQRATAVDPTLLQQQIADIFARFEVLRDERDLSDWYVTRLISERDTLLDQIILIVQALEQNRMVRRAADGAECVFVPAGFFAPGPHRRTRAEQRLARVFLRSFYMDRYPVTNAQFARFVQATEYWTAAEEQGRLCTWRSPHGPGSTIDRLADHPVVCVTRADAIAYATWAGRRLPTSLEWQRAARGVRSQIWPWGNMWDETACNINGYGTTSVKRYEQGVSPVGCYDMVGNVWEWLADTLEGKLLLIGGSWEPACLDLAPREYLTFQVLGLPDDGAKSSIGFRCAMNVPEHEV